VLSDKLENASKGTSTSTSCGTKIEPLRESSCAFLLEGLFASSVSGGSDFFRKAKNCLLSNAELNLLPTFGKYRFHSTRRAKTPSKRAEIDLRLSFLPREAFIFGSSTKTGPFHDLSRYPAHEEGPQHYGAKAEIERTSLLQDG
jgi:hypothetical protein